MIVISSITMLLLDAIYLMTFRKWYNSQIRAVQGSDVKLKIVPVILVYVAMIFGLNYFILNNRRPIRDAFLFGVVVSSVFNLTNMAIFDKWDIKSVMIDMLWGGILFSLTTFITYRVSNIKGY